MNEQIEPSKEGESLPIEVGSFIAANPDHPDRTDDRVIGIEILDGRSAVIAAIDGMGGGGPASSKAAGAVAERVTSMANGLLSVPSVDEGKELLGKALIAARDDIQRIPERKYSRNVDTVACVGMVCEENGKRYLVVANVGDARMNRYTSNSVTQISRDHSILDIKVRLGELTPLQAFNDPTRNLVYESVGSLKGTADINFDVIEIKEGDYFVASSDGYGDNIPPDELLKEFWEGVSRVYNLQKGVLASPIVPEGYTAPELIKLDLRRLARELVWRAQQVQIKEDGPNYKRPPYAKKDDTTVVVLHIPRKGN